MTTPSTYGTKALLALAGEEAVRDGDTLVTAAFLTYAVEHCVPPVTAERLATRLRELVAGAAPSFRVELERVQEALWRPTGTPNGAVDRGEATGGRGRLARGSDAVWREWQRWTEHTRHRVRRCAFDAAAQLVRGDADQAEQIAGDASVAVAVWSLGKQEKEGRTPDDTELLKIAHLKGRQLAFKAIERHPQDEVINKAIEDGTVNPVEYAIARGALAQVARISNDVLRLVTLAELIATPARVLACWLSRTEAHVHVLVRRARLAYAAALAGVSVEEATALYREVRARVGKDERDAAMVAFGEVIARRCHVPAMDLGSTLAEVAPTAAALARRAIASGKSTGRRDGDRTPEPGARPEVNDDKPEGELDDVPSALALIMLVARARTGKAPACLAAEADTLPSVASTGGHLGTVWVHIFDEIKRVAVDVAGPIACLSHAHGAQEGPPSIERERVEIVLDQREAGDRSVIRFSVRCAEDKAGHVDLAFTLIPRFVVRVTLAPDHVVDVAGTRSGAPAVLRGVSAGAYIVEAVAGDGERWRFALNVLAAA